MFSMLEKISDSHVIASWGSTVAVAWLLTILMGSQGFTAMEVMYMWTVLMLLPVALTAVLWHRSESNKLFNLWAVLVTLLMIENFVSPDSLLLYSYFHLWMVAGAAGFYYTSERLPPPSDKTYRYGAYASVIALPAVFYMPLLTPLLAAAVQGGPLLYDWYTVHR